MNSRLTRRTFVRNALGATAAIPLLRHEAAAAADPAPQTATPSSEVTLFAFDDRSVPLLDNLQLTLVQADKHPANPVLRCGAEGTPDFGHAVLYGSVIRVGDKFRMWYLGMAQRHLEYGNAPGYWRPMCYAESTDGITWTKPDLGLVEFNRSRKNNICLIESADQALTLVDDFLTVLYEPAEPDPERRYKCAFIAHVPWADVKGGIRAVGRSEGRLCAMMVATSADGLSWRVLGDRPRVNEKFEVSGLYRFGNFYYATGQQISPWSWLPDGTKAGRVMSAYRSPDFLNWSSAKALAFARPGQRTSTPVAGQQTHMGAGLWNRGNVVVGLYGQWQDGPTERPKGAAGLWGTRIDLGLIVSNDGIHFREPVPDFKVIPRGREGEWDNICLLQGHAFAHVGDFSYIWYSHWDCESQFRSQEIGLATLRRDGFGYLARRNQDAPGHLITTALESAPHRKLFLNAQGVSADTPLTVELLDDFDRPIPGFSGADASTMTAGGTRQPVVWNRADAPPPGQRFAAKVTFPNTGNARVYAVYFGT